MNRKISISLSCLILFALFIVLSLFLSNSFALLDDTFAFETEAVAAFPISFFLHQIFGLYCPLFLHLHPSDFKSEYFNYIESFILILCVLGFNHFLFFKQKINLLFPLSLLFSASLLFHIINQQVFVLFVIDGFFRLFLPSFFLIGLFYSLINPPENKIFKIVLPSILFFICCLLNEYTCMNASVSLFLLILIKIFKNPKNKKNHLILLLYFIISAVVLIIFSQTHAFSRKEYIFEKLPSLYDKVWMIIKLIPDFIRHYIKVIFINHWLEYLILLVQIIILFFKRTNEQKDEIKNTIKIILYFLVGTLVFFFSLIIIGKTYNDENINYYIVHPDLHIIYDILLCSFIYVLARLIIKYKIINHYVFGAILLASSFFLIKLDYFNYSNTLNIIKYTKQNYYKTEKILRVAALNNKMAILPNENLDWTFKCLEGNCEDNKEYQESFYINYINQFSDFPINIKFMFKDQEEVEKAFRENGGTFTDEELEELKFTKLFDKTNL